MSSIYNAFYSFLGPLYKHIKLGVPAFFLLAIFSCSKEDPKSSDNRITSFQLNVESKTYDGHINGENGKITFELDEAIQTSIVPSIDYASGASISPAITSPQNFNTVVRYTVTAENGAEKTYTVVTNTPNSHTSNIPPGNMELVTITFEEREVHIDWTDAMDSDNVVYTIFKNSIEAGEYSISEATLPFTYNQTEKIIVFATDKKGGTSKLEFEFESPKSELIFVKNFSGILYAIDTKVQDILWVGKSTDGFFAPIIHGNQVFSSWDNKLIGQDLITGDELQVYDSIVSASYDRYDEIVVDQSQNVLYFKKSDGYVYARDATSNNELWKTYLSNINSVFTPAVLTESNLYTMRGRNDILYSINKFSGEIEWQYDLLNGSSGGVPFTRGTPLVIDQAIYFGDYGHLYSLEKDSGEVNWIINIPNNARPSSFTQYGDELIVIAASEVYGVNPANGTILWSNTLSNYIVSTPFLEGGRLFLGSAGNGFGTVLAINAENGEKLWENTVEGAVSASPVIFEGKLYICDREGFLYCYDKNNGNLIWKMTIGAFVTTSPTFVKGNGDTIIYPNVIGFD